MSSTSLQFRCPKTGAFINTGIETTSRGVADNWDQLIHLKCPACGESHAMKVRDLFTPHLFDRDDQEQRTG